MTVSEVIVWLKAWDKLIKSAESNDAVRVLVAPCFIHLPLFTGLENIYSCGQDVSENSVGPYTGYVNATQLREFADYSIVGHSERNEDSETVVKKINQCRNNGIEAIACFTHTENATEYSKFTKILAWEDPENISKQGKYAELRYGEINHSIEKIYSNIEPDTVLLYGGSVNSNNISELTRIKSISGFLVGNASLDVAHFYKLYCSMI